MATTQTLLKSARLFHLYSGVFLAPALLFFAFTGGIQTFSLHETTRGSSYKPPAILVELGQLHKKQTLVVPTRKGPSPNETKPAPRSGGNDQASEANSGQQPARKASRTPDATAGSDPAAPPTPPAAPAKVHNLLPMKIFFLIVAIGLFFSTLTGLYMAYRFSRNKKAITAVLAAGIAVPLLLLLF